MSQIKTTRNKINYNPIVVIALKHDVVDIHLEKDLVQIPLTFSKLGFITYFIVNSISNLKFNNINILELRSTNILKKFYATFVFIRKIKPKIIFTYYLWHHQVFFNIIVNIIRKIQKSNNYLIVKLDYDGNLRAVSLKKKVPLLLLKLLFFFNAITADLMVIESNEAKKRLLSYYGRHCKKILDKKTYVMPNGLSSDTINKFRQYSDRYARQHKIIVNSVVTERKGLYELLVALNNIKNSLDNWKIHIVGPIQDHEYYSRLIDYIRKNKLENNVVFLGKLTFEELIKEYVTSEIFILPSKAEGFSIARLNAMAACLPIITTDTGGAEIVKNCCGIVVPIDNIYELSEVIKKLIGNDKLRSEYSNVACEKIKEYNWEKLIINLINYIGIF